MLRLLEEKIAEFETHGTTVTSGVTLPTDLYKILSIQYTNSSNVYIAQKITKKEFDEYRLAFLPIVSIEKPVYTQSSSGIKLYTTLTKSSATNVTADVTIDYIRKPVDAAWGYNIIVGQALYDASNSTDFELHPSEETSLVNEILELAGILMEKPQLVAIADREEDKKIQQQKI
jgi:hypothetical protein